MPTPQKPKRDTYYQDRKDDPAFKEHRRLLAQRWREANTEKWKTYSSAYHKTYYKTNRETLLAKRRAYGDLTRNERVNRFKQREREELGKNYIIQLLTRSGRLRREDITPYAIRKRREQIRAKRAAKGQ